MESHRQQLLELSDFSVRSATDLRDLVICSTPPMTSRMRQKHWPAQAVAILDIIWGADGDSSTVHGGVYSLSSSSVESRFLFVRFREIFHFLVHRVLAGSEARRYRSWRTLEGTEFAGVQRERCSGHGGCGVLI